MRDVERPAPLLALAQNVLPPDAHPFFDGAVDERWLTAGPGA